MNIPTFLRELRENNITVYQEDKKLKIKGPKNRIDAEIRKQLKDYKKEILAYLSQSNPPPIKGNVKIINKDCLEAMKEMPDNSIDCVVTDPPYGLSFMGIDWDKALPGTDIWREVLRVMKPGAFAFIMCYVRQDLSSRMVVNLSNAGFNVSFTSLYWTYATGFTHRHDISKVIDKKLGAKREILHRNSNSRENCNKSNTIYESGTVGKTAYITKPKTEQAKKFEGAYAGFQPKPAVEMILVAMKPREELSYTKQAMVNGKGCTWLDDCSIPYNNEADKDLEGRVMANLLVSDNILDDEIIREGGFFPSKRGQSEYFELNEKKSDRSCKIKDKGSYSRYFSLDAWWHKKLPFLIESKPSKKEKNAGLEGFEKKQIIGRDIGQDRRNNPYKIRPSKRCNDHQTVKPIKLKSYLVALGSRETDTILDPFCGSGPTCIAAALLNRKAIGIDKNEYYCKIAAARVRYWLKEKNKHDKQKAAQGQVIKPDAERFKRNTKNSKAPSEECGQVLQMKKVDALSESTWK